MSTFTGLHIGLSALRAQQTIQETIGQNVANIDTPGYSRRTAHLVALDPPLSPTGERRAGMGVDVASISRSASALLNEQIQHEGSTLSYWTTVCAGMSQLEGLFQEPGSDGLSALLNDFWAAWKDLSVDPTSQGARTSVRQTAEVLVTFIRRTYDGIRDFSSGLDTQLRIQIGRINVLAEDIAAINRQVTQAMAGGDPANDLRDQRDMLLEELTQVCHARSAENVDGSLTIMLDGHLLVDSRGAYALTTKTDSAGIQQPTWEDNGLVAIVSGGEVGATLGLRDWAQHEVLPELHRLTGELIQAVNTLHTSGFTLNNDPGGAFFVGTDAHDIALSDTIAGDLNAIAASSSPDAPGDGSIALQIARLQEEHRAALGDSIGGAYAAIVAGIGLDVQKAETMSLNQEALVRFLRGQRENLAGVSLDEEAVHMVAAQRAYQAAARVITAVDEMLDHLINNTGLVGR